MTLKKPTYDELKQQLEETTSALRQLQSSQPDAMESVASIPSEQHLVESERRYRALFENMNAGYVLFEVVQDDNGTPIDLTILAANSRFELTTGLDVSEIIGTRLSNSLPGIESDAANWINTYGSIALTGESQHFEQYSELLKKHYSVVAYQAAPKQCAVTFLDISAQKAMEADKALLQQQLNHSQKLDSMGRLAGGIAHDFNNILVPIRVNAKLALMQEIPEASINGNLERIIDAVDRAADLTGQILAFSRKQVLQPTYLSLNTVITDFSRLLGRLIGEDIKLEFYLAEDLGKIHADKSQIEQVLLNLVVNSRDAMPEGGNLVIETGSAYLDADYVKQYWDSQAPGNYIMLAVSDTGEGMSKEIQDRIFEPFFTTKAIGEGTGLGLSTVFGIVKQHQGNLWVYSEPGKGTTIKIYLPQSDSSEVTIKPQTPEPTTLYGQESILVVEDEEMVREVVSESLTAFGYEVSKAAGPVEALELARNMTNPPALLLTDVIMPGKNGRELYAEIRNIYPEIRVLFMSGYTDNIIMHHGILDSDVDLLAKPFSVQNLIKAVRQSLDKTPETS